MDRINHASAEADKFGAGKDGWTNGDPLDESTGTVPQEEWFDGVQEELVGLIEDAGLTPDAAQYNQVREALGVRFAGHSIVANLEATAHDFGSGYYGTGFWYFPELGKWWCMATKSGAGITIWDSDDGLTWSAGYTTAAAHFVQGPTRPVTDGTVVRFVASDQVYESSDGTAAAITVHSVIPARSFGFKTAFKCLTYSGSAWVCGLFPDSTPQPIDEQLVYNTTGTTWTNCTFTGDTTVPGGDYGSNPIITGLDSDGVDNVMLAHYSLEGSDVGGHLSYSTDGGLTFSLHHQFADNNFQARDLYWSPSMAAWLVNELTVSITNDLWYSMNGTTWTNSGLTVYDSSIDVNPYFVSALGATGSGTTGIGYPFYVLYKIPNRSSTRASGTFAGELGMRPQGIEFKSGDGKFLCSAGTNDTLYVASWW